MFSWAPCIARLTTNTGRVLLLDGRRWMSKSYYDILKISQNCSSKEVRDAFINLSKQNHPDKHGNDPAMHERFVRINEAYSVLINPTSRRSYDMSLVSKRKLNAPYVRSTKPQSYYSGQQAQSNQNERQGNSSYSRASGSSGEDYFYTSWDKTNWEKASNARGADNEDYYGIKGVKKVPNSTILLLILGFMCVGGIFQWIVIQTYSKSVRKKMLEQTQRLSLIHSMAREKARLYGNEYQISILKSTLMSTYGESDTPETLDIPVVPSAAAPEVSGTSPQIPSSPQELGGTCDICENCKKS